MYVSRPAQTVTRGLLDEILGEARGFNQLHGVTGYLVHLGEVFIQYLEGNEDTVQRLYDNIAADPRHSDVTLIAEGSRDKRLFEGWTMGASSHTPSNGPGIGQERLFETLVDNPSEIGRAHV